MLAGIININRWFYEADSFWTKPSQITAFVREGHCDFFLECWGGASIWKSKLISSSFRSEKWHARGLVWKSRGVGGANAEPVQKTYYRYCSMLYYRYLDFMYIISFFILWSFIILELN